MPLRVSYLMHVGSYGQVKKYPLSSAQELPSEVNPEIESGICVPLPRLLWTKVCQHARWQCCNVDTTSGSSAGTMLQRGKAASHHEQRTPIPIIWYNQMAVS